MDDSRSQEPLTRRELAIRYVVHAVLSLGIAGAVWHQRLAGLVDPQDVQRYLPLGFAVLTGLVLILGARLRRAPLSIVLGLDLIAWLSLPAAIIATRISPIWYGGWLTGAITVKLVPLLWVLFLRVRSGLADRLSALSVSTVFLVSSLLMLPYTRFTVPGAVGITGDEPHFLTVTANLLAGGGFWVGKAYTNGIFAKVYGSSIPFAQAHVVRTATGHYGPGHDLGVSLLAVPFYAAGGTKAVMVAMALIASVAAYEIYLLLRAIRVDARVALLVTVLATFSLPYLPEATQVSPEVSLACCAAIVARRLFARSGSPVDVVVVGIALAAMPWLQVRGWPIVIPLLIGALLTWRSWFARSVVLGIVAASSAAYWSLLYSIYGEFIISPVSLQPGLQHLPPLRITHVVAALESVLVDPVAGLLPNAPIWILAIGGLFLLVRRSVAGAATTAAIVIYVGFVGTSALRGTTQGYGPPGRFSVVLVPLLAPALALAWERTTGQWWSEIRWALVAWTAVCAFAVQAVRVTTYYKPLLATLAGLFGERVPVLDEGHTAWVLLGLMAVFVAMVVVAIGAVPLPRPRPKATADLDVIRPGARHRRR